VGLPEDFLSRNQILDPVYLDRVEVLFVGILPECPLRHAFVQWAPHSGGRILHEITLGVVLEHVLAGDRVGRRGEAIQQDSSEDVFGVLQNAELAEMRQDEANLILIDDFPACEGELLLLLLGLLALEREIGSISSYRPWHGTIGAGLTRTLGLLGCAIWIELGHRRNSCCAISLSWKERCCRGSQRPELGLTCRSKG